MNATAKIILFACACHGVATLETQAAAPGCDPAISHMEVASQWRYRDPYAKRMVSVTLTNLGAANYEGAKGQQCICVYAKEASVRTGVVRERIVMRLPFERVAAGQEITFKGQYFQEIERYTNPARMSYRAEIVYEPANAYDGNGLNDDANTANNRATPNLPNETTVVVANRR